MYTEWDKSRFTVVHVENNTVMIQRINSVFMYSQLQTYFCPTLYMCVYVCIN